MHNITGLTRRNFLQVSSTGACAMAVSAMAPVLVADGDRLSAVEESLKTVYADSFLIGAAIPGAGLNEAERSLLFRHFNAVTSENCMKPLFVHPAEDKYDFKAADALVKMVKGRGLAINGHTLIWHAQCPDWFFREGGKAAGRDLVLKRMQKHISEVAGHFAGEVKSWDVVNEAIGKGDAYLRESKWLTSIGEDFIYEAFVSARRADPGAELYYNDFAIERQPKRDKALRLINDLKKRKAPIQGIGIQGHWELDKIPFEDIEEAIIAFHAQGLKVMITELDIDVVGRETESADVEERERGDSDPFAKGLPLDVQKRLAEQYAKLFELFIRHRDKIDRVTFWGLYDGRSWLNKWPFKRTNHPLLWDRHLKPKPAFDAVVNVGRKAR